MSFFWGCCYNEIKSSGAVVKKRCGAGGQADASQFQANLAAQLATEIYSINVIDSVGAGALYDAITVSGLDEANTQSLVAVVDAKVQATSKSARGTVCISRLSVIANHHIPQRKNNKLLGGGTALSSIQLASEESRSPSSNSA